MEVVGVGEGISSPPMLPHNHMSNGDSSLLLTTFRLGLLLPPATQPGLLCCLGEEQGQLSQVL